MIRLGIAGCGYAARVHARRLAVLPQVEIVGFADPDTDAAAALARELGASGPAFPDHRALLAQASPDALAIFTPHRFHYRLAMDALQAGCHVFIEKPLSTNVQEAADIVNLARGRGLKVGVGHQYRLSASFREVRQRLAHGEIGPVHLVSATMAQPWLATHSGPEESWRLDPKLSGGGMLADSGDHLLDTLLWTTGLPVLAASAFQEKSPGGLDLVTAASLRLNGALASVNLSGLAAGNLLELVYHGERGYFRATERTLSRSLGGPEEPVPLPEDSEAPSIDANFLAALRDEAPLCCSAEDAIETVRLLDALGRSAATGQVVRLS